MNISIFSKSFFGSVLELNRNKMNSITSFFQQKSSNSNKKKSRKMPDSRLKNVSIEAERSFSVLNYIKNDFGNSIGKFIFSQNTNYFR